MKMLTALLSSFLFWMSAAAFAENLVIVAASGESAPLQPGAVVETGTVINLPVGASLTLLSQTGAIVKLDGPFSNPLTLQGTKDHPPKEGKWSAALSNVAKVVSKKVDRTNVIGSSRDLDAKLENGGADAWALTVDSSGHRCLHAGGSNLWRKNADKSLEIDLRSQEAQAKGLIWQAGINRMKLPQKFVKDGTLVVMKVDAQPRRFNIHVLPNEIGPERWGDVLHWMIVKKCNRQASLLVEGLHSGQIKVRE